VLCATRHALDGPETHVADMMPRQMYTSAPHGGSGIFGMDEAGGRVYTAGKDATVVESTFTSSELKVVREWDEHHSGVVKCVRVRSGGSLNEFASCGVDGRIHIYDGREPGNVMCLEEHFAFSVNSVCWQPSSSASNILMAAGNDPFIKVFDIRHPAKPLHILTGHQGMGISRVKQIYHPIFCANGAGIISQGEGSDHITLFNTQTGNIVSRSQCRGDKITKIAIVRDKLCVAAKYGQQMLGLMDTIRCQGNDSLH